LIQGPGLATQALDQPSLDRAPRAEAFDMMKLLLRELLDDTQKLSTQAKNPAARRAAQNRVIRIRDALKAADEAI
jgi:hypothetical protein